MIQFVAWYIVISLLGLLTFPFAFRAFPALADRGYSLSRALGLLIWAFVFWLLVSLGLLRNDIGGLLFALFVLAGLSAWSVWVKAQDDTDHRWIDLQEVTDWMKANIRLVFSIEALFLLAFAAWAFVRASNPEMTSAGGEKWMEVAFINAILHSPTFPPHDPWLSGYAISYYYFGYVMAAMLAMITGTPGSVAHNLMLSLVFAMSVIGSYGVLFNLLSAYWGAGKTLRSGLYAIFGPLFLVLMGNVEGFLELLHAFGIGWNDSPSTFWVWLNMKDLSDAPTVPYGWQPRFWFWWRASRIVHDYDFRGHYFEIIDEFPFFSYLLGDLHPHVLAMPFGLLAAALAINIYLGGWKGVTDIFGFKLPVQKTGLALLAAVLGGLAFLNTWDFPIYLALVSGAFLLSLAREKGWSWVLLEDILKFSIPVAILSVVAYLPFYVGFSSQAGGILPNVIYPTRGVYLWIMFGVLFIPMFMLILWAIGKQRANWKNGFLLVLGFTALLWVISLALGVIASQTELGKSFITDQGYTSTQAVLTAATLRRVQYGAGLLTLVLLIGAALSFVLGSVPSKMADLEEGGLTEETGNPQILPYVFLLIVLGGLMVMAPEFVYLRDQFGWRINTVFKFYYQAWSLWAVAGAFGAAVVLQALRDIKAMLASAIIAVVVLIGMTYPVLALPNKTENFRTLNPDQRTLDGAAYISANNPDDYAAMTWLSQQPLGTLAEAVGGSYTEFARVSTYSGQPAVLGWPGHESQWRGGYAEMGSRSDDIARLYTTDQWGEAQALIQQYGIRYIYIGPLERSTYQVNETKFSENLAEIYRQGSVVIYQAP